MEGLISYLIFFVTTVSIFGLLTLALNIQWGFAGMLNIGIAAFFAIGAYTSALVSTPVGTAPASLGGPIIVGLVIATLISGLIALGIGLITLRLRTDYLAIATIGIAEIIRLILKNEEGLTNGVRGLGNIPRPLKGWVTGGDDILFMLLALGSVALVYIGSQRLYHSPWGRVQRAIRDNEIAASAMGKNVLNFRLQAFVIGSMIMGFAGGLYAHFVGFISPEAFDPLFATFLIWVMLMAGGSGNNKGALAGTVVVWGIWTLSETLINRLPPEFITQAGSLRILLVGILLVLVLLYKPGGIFPEEHATMGGKKK